MSINLGQIEREVVAKRLAIVTVVTGLLHAVVALHWLTSVQSDQAISYVTSALDFLGVAAGAAYVRKAVTPVSDPKANDGTPLEPVSALPVVADDPAEVAATNAALADDPALPTA